MDGTEIRKEEVEQLLGCGITDGQFGEALAYAKRKQDYIYGQERRPVVLERWYLAKLTEEYVRSLAFSRLTVDLCRNICNMKKEHPLNKEQDAPPTNHIVSFPASQIKQKSQYGGENL